MSELTNDEIRRKIAQLSWWKSYPVDDRPNWPVSIEDTWH